MLHPTLRHACGWQLGLWPHDMRCRSVCRVDRKVASGDRLRTAALTCVPYMLRTSNVHGFLLGIVNRFSGCTRRRTADRGVKRFGGWGVYVCVYVGFLLFLKSISNIFYQIYLFN